MKSYVEIKNVKDLCKVLGLPASYAPKVEMRRDLVIGIREAMKR